ncbi:MAG: cysteine-rich small domain-containing protein, partial [Promethearchaeota archaeon]
DGLEDCTFCYCPFYPCYQTNTGGFEKISSRTGQPVWACSSCIFPHKTKNAQKILEGLIELNLDFNSIPKEKLKELRSKILNLIGK